MSRQTLAEQLTITVTEMHGAKANCYDDHLHTSAPEFWAKLTEFLNHRLAAKIIAHEREQAAEIESLHAQLEDQRQDNGTADRLAVELANSDNKLIALAAEQERLREALRSGPQTLLTILWKHEFDDKQYVCLCGKWAANLSGDDARAVWYQYAAHLTDEFRAAAPPPANEPPTPEETQR